MVLFVCACLNARVHVHPTNGGDPAALELMQSLRRPDLPAVFSSARPCVLNLGAVSVEQPLLITCTVYGAAATPWSVFRCLGCNMDILAVPGVANIKSLSAGAVLVADNLAATAPEGIQKLRASAEYSPAMKILVSSNAHDAPASQDAASVDGDRPAAPATRPARTAFSNALLTTLQDASLKDIAHEEELSRARIEEFAQKERQALLAFRNCVHERKNAFHALVVRRFLGASTHAQESQASSFMLDIDVKLPPASPNVTGSVLAAASPGRTWGSPAAVAAPPPSPMTPVLPADNPAASPLSRLVSGGGASGASGSGLSRAARNRLSRSFIEDTSTSASLQPGTSPLRDASRSGTPSGPLLVNRIPLVSAASPDDAVRPPVLPPAQGDFTFMEAEDLVAARTVSITSDDDPEEVSSASASADTGSRHSGPVEAGSYAASSAGGSLSSPIPTTKVHLSLERPVTYARVLATSLPVVIPGRLGQLLAEQSQKHAAQAVDTAQAVQSLHPITPQTQQPVSVARSMVQPEQPLQPRQADAIPAPSKLHSQVAPALVTGPVGIDLSVQDDSHAALQRLTAELGDTEVVLRSDGEPLELERIGQSFRDISRALREYEGQHTPPTSPRRRSHTFRL
jgi:hypothetical protein